MTVQILPRSESQPRRSSLDHSAAMELAATEYTRGGELLQRLEADHWSAPTVNAGWDVRATAGRCSIGDNACGEPGASAHHLPDV